MVQPNNYVWTKLGDSTAPFASWKLILNLTDVKNWATQWMYIIIVQKTDGTWNGLDKTLRDSLSHTLNGNNKDRLTGMLWELNEFIYVEGLANYKVKLIFSFL